MSPRGGIANPHADSLSETGAACQCMRGAAEVQDIVIVFAVLRAISGPLQRVTPPGSTPMHSHSLDQWTHDHLFLGPKHAHNERRTWFVVALTAVMMVGEIVAGTLFGSMALLADGWHMATHAAALGIAALAYYFARSQARNSRFTFGTGKFGDLAAFASAMILAIVALQIAFESLERLVNP